jgi:hypothetical protein
MILVIVSEHKWIVWRMPDWMLGNLCRFVVVLTVEVFLKVFARVCTIGIVCYGTVLSVSRLFLWNAWDIFTGHLVSIVITGSSLCET